MMGIRKLFKDIYKLPDPQLKADIWFLITERQARVFKQKIVLYLSVCVLSMAGLVLVIKDLVSESSQSGFSTYISAALSGGKLAVLYWKELLLSLADSLPIASLLFAFLFLLIIFVSIRKAASQIKSLPLRLSMQI